MTDVKYVLKEGECMEKVEDTENEYKYKFYVGSIYTAFRQWQVGILSVARPLKIFFELGDPPIFIFSFKTNNFFFRGG